MHDFTTDSKKSGLSVGGKIPAIDSPLFIVYTYLTLYQLDSPMIVVADDPQVKLLFNAELDFKYGC